jgi:hypothetical protein
VEAEKRSSVNAIDCKLPALKMLIIAPGKGRSLSRLLEQQKARCAVLDCFSEERDCGRGGEGDTSVTWQ